MGSRFRRLRARLSLARPSTVAIVVSLACGSAAGTVLGVATWQPSWLGNIASAIVVAFATAVFVDVVVVSRRRRRSVRALAGAQFSVDVCSKELAEQAGNFAADATRSDLHDENAFLVPLLSATYLDDHLVLWRDRLFAALTDLALLAGIGMANSRIDEVDTRLRTFVVSYGAVCDAQAALREARRSSRPRSIFDQPVEYVSTVGYVTRTEHAREQCINAYDEVVGYLANITELNSAIPIQDYVANRVPFRLPPWLRAIAGLVTVLWLMVLLWAAAHPTSFPVSFAADGAANLAADGVVALFAAAIAIALAENSRIDLLGRAFEPARQLNELGYHLLTMGLETNPKLRESLRASASITEDLVDAISAERPDAELSLRGRRVVTAMRVLGRSAEPLWESDRDRLDAFVGRDKDPAGASLRSAVWDRERAKADTTPRHSVKALHEMLMELGRLADVAGLVSRGDR